MADYPVNLDITDRLCVVIGGGKIALRKVCGLLAAGAKVRLITRDLPPEETWTKPVEVHHRAYRSGDLADALLAFAATGDVETDEAVAREAKSRSILLNHASFPDQGNFTMPAVLRRGDLQFAVSSTGRSPALACLLRDRLQAQWGEEWALLLEVAAALRQRKLTGTAQSDYNSTVLEKMLDAGLPQLFAQGRWAEIDRVLATLLGEGHSLAELGINRPERTP